ncbi:HopJ type III effector protein [Methylovulum sp.]|uniref:HopJ type III effector protein n=1 Tax=Methylovulum sp. TaxID=1916980 RepID=UPI0026224CFB|nr:HopJ type III effector protein [Methylovulum sp.]MDD5124598.1 HopJ type III effector protein [Methylovulum sp.]
MSLPLFLEKIKNNVPVSFAETMAVISDNYHYQPTEFSNGDLVNAAGTNEGSCRIFAFAQLNQLDPQQTLNLFGDYYRQEVLNDPHGTSHQNIRNFMQQAWGGIHFNGQALTAIS